MKERSRVWITIPIICYSSSSQLELAIPNLPLQTGGHHLVEVLNSMYERDKRALSAYKCVQMYTTPSLRGESSEGEVSPSLTHDFARCSCIQVK